MATPGRDHLRAAHADREHVIEALKAAFVQGRLSQDEFNARVGQALAARTYADLATLTADLPAGPIPVRPPRKPVGTMAKATIRSGLCLLIAAALVGVAFLIDNDGATTQLIFLAALAVMAASGFFGYGIVDSWEEKRSRRQVTPGPGPRGQSLEGQRHGETGRDPAPPGALSLRWGRAAPPVVALRFARVRAREKAT